MKIRTVRLPLFLAMEIAWGFALAAVAAQALSDSVGAGPSLVAVAAVVLISFGLSRLLGAMEIDETTMRVVGVVATIVLLLVILRAEYMRTAPFWDTAWMQTVVRGSDRYTQVDAGVLGGTLVLIALWVRGLWRGQITDDFEGASRSAVFGLLPIAVAAATGPAARGFDAFGLLAIVYLLLALATLALYQAGEQDRTVGSLGAQWGTTAVVVLGIATVLAVLAAAVDPDAFGFLSPIGRPLRALGVLVGTYVLGPPLAGLAWLFDALLPDREPPPLQSDDGRFQPGDDDNDRETPWWVSVIQYGLVASFLTVAIATPLLLLALLFRRFRRNREVSDDRREALEADRALGDDLGELWDSLRGRFRRTGPVRSAVAIRRLYADMLAKAEADGLARPAAMTPLQFGPELAARYGSDTPLRITDAFDVSRYGARDMPPDEVRELEATWRALARGARGGAV